MPKPWERYAQEPAAGPWQRYGQQQPVPAPELPEDGVSQARGLGTAFGQGVLFGFGDELRGLAGAGADILGGLGGTQSFGDLYRLHRDIARREEQQYSEQNPILAGAAELGGGLATGLIGGAKAATTAAGRRLAANMAARPFGQRLAMSVPVGAAGGALGGALTAAGGAEEMADLPGDVVSAAGTGAAMGALLGPVGETAASGLQRAGGAIRRRLAPEPEVAAQRAVRSAVERQGMTPEDAVARMQALGPGATLADVGEGTRGLLDALAAQPGATGPAAIGQLARRSRMQIGELTEAIGEGRASQAIEASKQMRQQQASPLYQQAFREGVPHTETLEELFSRPAVERAWRRAKERGRDVSGIDPARLGDARPSLEGWQAVKEGLDDRITSLQRAGKPKQANEIRDNILQPLLDELDAQSPAYRQARGMWADSKSFDDAVESGRRFIREPSGVAAETLERLSDADRDAYRIGAVQAIQDKIEKSGWTHDLTKFFRTPAMERKLQALLGTEEFVDFMNRLEASRVKQQTFGLVGKGSQTAARQAAAADTNIAQALRDVGVDILTGTSPTASVVGRSAQMLRNLPIGGMPEAARDIAGRTLLETDPAMLGMALQRAFGPEPPLVTRGAGLLPAVGAVPLGILGANLTANQ